MRTVKRLPADDPRFDPEDDPGEYEPDAWTSADDLAFAYWSEVWPESIDPEAD